LLIFENIRAFMAKSRHTLTSIILGVTVSLGIALTFAAGYFLRDFTDGQIAIAADDTTSTNDFDLVVEVQALLDQVYLREQPSPTVRQYAAIRGLLSSLNDPNTFFIEPAVAQSEADTLAGTYGGVGVLVQRNEIAEFVLYPYPDGPAATAGIEDGDVLLEIDGISIDVTEPQDAVDQRMRGEVIDNNGVELTVRKLGGEIYTEFIPFDVINVPSVFGRVLVENESIGYVQILRFTNRTPSELTTILEDLNVENLEALIIDLRNNSGGLLQESIDIAGFFLSDGSIAIEQSKDDERVFSTSIEGNVTSIPLVVLVNHRTASASELVAGALRDRGRAILIGQTTFGKGTVQQIFTLSDGSSVHVTSAQWLTPNRTPLDGSGLVPDIEMIPAENGRDVELGEAIRYIQMNYMQENE
jgi:carboxyl-terminal processing protease